MKSSRSKEDLVLDLFNGRSSLKIRKQAETKKKNRIYERSSKSPLEKSKGKEKVFYKRRKL